MRLIAAAVLALATVSSSASADATTCRRLAVTLLIDRSGSMNGKKLDDAKAAASAAVDRLGADDCVSIVAFDSSPTTIVALQTVDHPAAVKAAIARVQVGGGTDLLSALAAAHGALGAATRAQRKHVVLLTDGQSPVAGLDNLARTMRAEHMTLSTVGLGTDIDEPTLRRLATDGGGRYYRATSSTSLEDLFTREIRRALGG